MSEPKPEEGGLAERLLRRVAAARGADPLPADRVLRSPSRVAALRRADLLDTPSEEVFDRLTRIAARALDAPVALFTLLDEERQFCKSMVGLPSVWLSGRNQALCDIVGYTCEELLARTFQEITTPTTSRSTSSTSSGSSPARPPATRSRSATSARTGGRSGSC